MVECVCFEALRESTESVCERKRRMHDPTNTWIVYLDANNLYGDAMSTKLHSANFDVVTRRSSEDHVPEVSFSVLMAWWNVDDSASTKRN